jgi:sulfhydrogenase subunit gamma (sulfur reductase)
MREAEAQPKRRLRLEAVERQTPLAWLFRFGAADGASRGGVEYAPGQVAILETDDGRVGYIAIASPPGAGGGVEFLIKGAGPVGERLFASGEGYEVTMAGPYGTGFDVDAQEGRDLVLVAQGTAIGAIRSALLHALRRRDRFGSVTLIYGVRTPDDFNFADEFDVWRARGVKVELTCTQPGGVWVGAQGRVQTLLEQAVRDALEPVALICGSPQMLDESAAALEALGLPRDRILRNY